MPPVPVGFVATTWWSRTRFTYWISKDKPSADALDKLAGQPVKGKGEARGDIIEDQSLAGAE